MTDDAEKVRREQDAFEKAEAARREASERAERLREAREATKGMHGDSKEKKAGGSDTE